jgi:hypothetical protein
LIFEPPGNRDRTLVMSQFESITSSDTLEDELPRSKLKPKYLKAFQGQIGLSQLSQSSPVES